MGRSRVVVHLKSRAIGIYDLAAVVVVVICNYGGQREMFRDGDLLICRNAVVGDSLIASSLVLAGAVIATPAPLGLSLHALHDRCPS